MRETIVEDSSTFQVLRLLLETKKKLNNLALMFERGPTLATTQPSWGGSV